MKKLYNSPQIFKEELHAADVMTASGYNDSDDGFFDTNNIYDSAESLFDYMQ